MSSAAAIRLQIEAALAHRIPSALSPRPRIIRPVAPTGVAALDELLDGGLPLGAVTEMTGPECSGRSSVALSFVSRFTQVGSVCAWIDVSDAFNPESAAAAGVDLSRLLWVRCAVSTTNAQPLTEYKFVLPEKYLIPTAVKQGLHGGGCGGHPRNEVKGLSEAVSGLLRPAGKEQQPKVRQEQVALASLSRPPASHANVPARAGKPWARIEQALRVTDLLLQAGGFSAIVLDMAGIAAEHVSRVPMATWFRYRTAAERTQASVLLLTQHPCAKSSGELLLRFQPGKARRDEVTVFTGLEHRVEIERQRFATTETNVIPLRKPPQSTRNAHWNSQTSWTGAR
jgi:recombination protein RecA